MTFKLSAIVFSGLAFTLIPFSLSAFAQSTIQDIERITTTYQRYQFIKASDVNTIDTLSEQTLRSLAPTHIEEALRRIAGVGLQRGSGQEYLPALRSPVLTGAGACGAVLTSEDSIPIRAAGFCNNNELFEAHTEMAQRIDVIKGPATVVFGSNALHGVINVVTPDTTENTGFTGVDIGSYGYKRIKARIGKGDNISGVGLNASITRDNGFRDDEAVYQEKVNGRHRYEFENASVTTGLTYTHLDQQTAGYLTGDDSYRNDELINKNENPEAYRRAKALRVWSKWDWQPDQDQRVTVTPYFRNQDMQFVMHFLPGKPLEINSQQGAGVLTAWQYQSAKGTDIAIGLDLEKTEGQLRQFQDGPTIGSEFLRETIPAGEHYDYRVDAELLAPFVQLSKSWQGWTATLGARYETMSYDYQSFLPAGRNKDTGEPCGFGGCRYNRPADREVAFKRLSPKLHINYLVNDSLSVYASLADGFRIPQATELFRLQRDQGIAELKPETGLNREVGVHYFKDALSLSAAYYLLRKENVIYRNSDFFNVSNGKTRHEGIELSLRWRFHSQWTLSSALTYSKHTYVQQANGTDLSIQGNEMDTAPRRSANTQITWQSSDALEFELEWQHISKYFTDAENMHTYPGHDIFSLRSHYQLNPNTTLRFHIDNLFDTRYAERADFTTFSGARYFPGQPRHFLIAAEYSW